MTARRQPNAHAAWCAMILAASMCGACNEAELAPWRPLPMPAQPLALARTTPPADVIPLLDHLGAARITGHAAGIEFANTLRTDDEDAVRAIATDSERSLIEASFDDGLLTPFDAKGDGRVRVVSDARDAETPHLRIEGPATSARVESQPIAVRGGTRIAIEYRTRCSSIEVEGAAITGVASLFVGTVDEGTRRRIPLHLGLSRGTQPWQTVSAEVTLPLDAETLVLALDLARASSDASARVTGRVDFDDVRVYLVPASPFTRHQSRASDSIAEHPLVGRVRTGGQTRDVLYAPVSSSIEFDLDLPPSAVLEIGMGLLPAHAPANGRVVFEIEIDDGTGPRRIERVELPGRRRRWTDRRLTLSKAGGPATLRLITRGRERPGRYAVWSEPWVTSRTRQGRRAVLVGIDTLGAHRTSLAGIATLGAQRTSLAGELTGPAQTPHLATLAERGTVYRRAYSPATWTLPAFASIFTGLGPGAHGAGARDLEGPAQRAALPMSAATVSERLRAAGWQTRAFVNNPFLSDTFGIDQGFGRYVDVGTRHRPGAGLPAVERAMAWLGEPVSADRFVFLHMMEPHAPYRPTLEELDKLTVEAPAGMLEDGMQDGDLHTIASAPAAVAGEERSYVAALHDATVRDVDRLLAPLWALLEHDVDAPVWIAVTSDHGEELWEHGYFEHGHATWDEVVRVPLVVVPGSRPGEVVDTPTSTAGLAGELLRFAHIEGRTPDLASAPRTGGQSLYGPPRWYHSNAEHRLVLHPGGSRSAGPRSPGAHGPGEWLALAPGSPPPSSAATFEAFDQIAADWLRSLRGRWVVAIAPGLDDAGALDGVILGAHEFDPAPERLAWPAAGGELQDVLWLGDGRFRIPRTGGLIAIEPTRGLEHELTIRLEGAIERNVVLTRDDAAHPGVFFANAAESGPRLLVGFVPEATASSASLEGRDATLEQLRALGYVE